MRRLILYAMFFCILLFLIVGLAGFFFLSNSYYAEFAENQNELLESYYHYIDKGMEDATRTSLSIIADESIQQDVRREFILVSDVECFISHVNSFLDRGRCQNDHLETAVA